MLIRTHYAITLFFVLLFWNSVNDKLVFLLVAMIATVLPDIDSRFSSIGRKKIARVLQFFTKHRGIIHSFTFLILITIGLVFVFPIVAFGFFLGYGFHLLADSFTKDGITPFYPYKIKSRGSLTTGGRIEIIVLISFLFLDIFLILQKIVLVF